MEAQASPMQTTEDSSEPSAEPTPAVPERLVWVETHREQLGWLVAVIFTFGFAIGIYFIQSAYPIPPGGDPGNWISISYAYIGGHYSGQVSPYGYPPLLFPILGLLVLVTGSPLAAGFLIVPILIVALGLSTYALSRAMIRSVILSLAFVAILCFDPFFMTMFFWGALPNLLAFVFMNLSLLGLVWTGAGRVTRGVLFFWGFLAATILTHSLVGLALVATAGVLLVLSMFVPLAPKGKGRPSATSASASARSPTSPAPTYDAPSLLIRRLFLTLPGFLGLVAVIVSVGGWYLAIHLLGIAQPGYFTPGSAVQPAGFGQFLRNLLPGLSLGRLTVFYILVVLILGVLSVFGLLLRYRTSWISTSLLTLTSLWLAIPGMGVLGWLLSVSTDYHRFGFLLVIPAGLSIAFVIDRLWLGRGPTAPESIPRSTEWQEKYPDPDVRPFPPTIRATRRARTAFVGVFAVVVILLAASLAIPTYQRYENLNAGPTHSQDFLDALNAIKNSGLSGSVLTIKGNLKWTWAVTQRDAYAPRPGNAFLFYPVQIKDSALSYYALTAQSAMTNGLVSASLRGTNAAYVDGVPDYQVYQNGGLAATLQIPPQFISVTLLGATNHTQYVVNVTGDPSFTPSPALGLPATISYVESSFTLNQSIVIPPQAPTAYVNTTVVARGADSIVAVQEVVTTPALLDARTQLDPLPGTFEWQTYGLRYQGLMTYGQVTPTTGLEGVTDYYPTTGGSAAILRFTPLGGVPGAVVTGSLSVTTPSAHSDIPGLPSNIDTPTVWQQLNIRFVILPNQLSFSLYAGSFLENEVTYLTGEFGCIPYYENSQWVVLLVPSASS